jgi:hypothetical protein
VIRAAALLAGLALGPAQAAAAQSVQIAPAEQTVQVTRVLLRGLDTLNGTATDVPVAVGETVRFGHLEIIADTCRVPRGDPTGDAYAFLRIRDIREQAPRFSGWMFASSPALSALDHPRYDVWVQSCSNS